jgi:hypothetical protein
VLGLEVIDGGDDGAGGEHAEAEEGGEFGRIGVAEETVASFLFMWRISEAKGS